MCFRNLLFKIDQNLTNIQSAIDHEEYYFVLEERKLLSDNLCKFYKKEHKKNSSLENAKYYKIIKELEGEIYFWLAEADEMIKENIMVVT